MMKNRKRAGRTAACLTAFCCAAGTSGAVVPAQAKEADTLQIVVIGDSISTGAGLASGEKSYVEQIQAYTGAEIMNFAQDAYTTADVCTCLEDAQVQQALAEADVILVSIGIHDIMDAFIARANGFMEEFGFVQFTDVFTAQLADYGFEDETELLPYSNEMAADIKANQETAAANIQTITEQLSVYQNAEIVYQTVYNLLDNIEMYDTLSMKRKVAYSSIMNPTGAVVRSCYNDYLAAYTAEQEHCVLVDTYTGFAGNAWQYTNLYDLEVNPNAAGHTWIANAVIAAAGLEEAAALQPGDANGDGETDAEDAALVMRFSAESGLSVSELLTEEQQRAADVDENGKADAYDAAQILQYAAAAGLNQEYEFLKATGSNQLNHPGYTGIPGDSGTAEDVTAVELVDADPYQPEVLAGITDADPYQPEVLAGITDAEPYQPVLL